MKIHCPEAIRKEFSFENMMDAIFTKNLTDENPIHGRRNVIHGWRNAIRGCHPCMASMDEDDG